VTSCSMPTSSVERKVETRREKLPVRDNPYVVYGIVYKAFPRLSSRSLPALFVLHAPMNKDENDLRGKKTPIEQMFREIVGREMTPNERRVLLRTARKKKKNSKN
jgi:hypothetical protein